MYTGITGIIDLIVKSERLQYVVKLINKSRNYAMLMLDETEDSL